MEPHGEQATTANAALQLWYAYPGDLSGAGVAEACTAILSDDERVRAARFRFERHRHEYLATHALARIALSHGYPSPPQAWSFSVNAYGKPSPIPEYGLHFNQSSTVSLAACLVARGAEVGVDVESRSRAEEIVGLASHVFSLAEQAQLQALPAAERPARALTLWTLKEAYIKARGMGLSLPLRGISFLFGGAQGTRLQLDAVLDDDPARWLFCLFDHSDHRIALAVDQSTLPRASKAKAAAAPSRPALQIWESHPLLSPPRRLPSGRETWFPILAEQRSSHAVR